MMLSNNGSSAIIVTVNKVQLLEILQKNLKNHIDEFAKACDIYRAKLAEEINSNLALLESYLVALKNSDFNNQPDAPRLSNKLPKPVSYAVHYERAIGMLKLHSKDEMTIDLSTYQKYVEDDWEWSSSAKVSNSSYVISSGH